MGWLIALGILTGLAILPLGVSVRYDADGFLARVILGHIRITVFPIPKWMRGSKKPETPAREPAPKETKPAQQATAKKGGSWKRFLPLVRLGLDLLGDFRRKLRVDRLELNLVLAGDDPCDLATNYGRAWAALGNLDARLERIFVIRKRNTQIQCDFTAEQILVRARLDLTITLGRLVAMTVVYGIRALILLMKMKKQGKKVVQANE